jgi:hypothetical protein
MTGSDGEERNKISYRRFIAGLLAGITVLSSYAFGTSFIKKNGRLEKDNLTLAAVEEEVEEENATAIIMEDYTAMLVDLDTSRHSYSPSGIFYNSDVLESTHGYVFPNDSSTIILFAKNGDEIVANTEYTKIVTGPDSHERAIFIVETQLGATLVTEYNTGKKLELTHDLY